MGGSLTTDATRNYHLILLFLCFFVSSSFGFSMTTNGPATREEEVPICERNGCNCTTPPHNWIVASCSFDDTQVVEVGAGAVPARLMELHVSGAQEVRFHGNTFSRVQNLRLLRVWDVHQLVVRRHAFLNVSSKRVIVEAHDCALVVMETHAFRASGGPASVNISRCAHVVLQAEPFSWLLRLELSSVARLQVASNAFALSQPQESRRHGPATVVLLRNVIVAELPKYTFPSLITEVRFVDAHIRTVRRDAFSAITFQAVLFQNTSLQLVEEGAFSERTLVTNLELSGVHVGKLASHSVRAAVSNLTVQHSNLSEVESGAVNITVAKVMLRDSNLDIVRTHGLVFSNWDSLQVENNTFRLLESDGILSPFQQVSGLSSYDFTFVGNTVSELQRGSLDFVASALGAEGLAARVDGTVLGQLCHCDLPGWLHGDPVLMDSSMCAVNGVLARCLGVPRGWASVRNYTELVCGQTSDIVCENLVPGMAHDNSAASPPSSAAAAPPDRERKVLALIFVAVVLGMLAILAVTGALWMRRKGYCVTARALMIPTTTASCITMLTRLLGTGVGAGTTRTVSQEYTELQQQNVPVRVLVDDLEAGEEDEDDDDDAPSEDKWTQTLPEELTQELLQQLREKLDDPENYSEARDMIEHLYDLIKVEESCSNNNKTTVPLQLENYEGENVYDVIQQSSPSVSRLRRNKDKVVCSVGTRAPSPDKLLPATTYAQAKELRRAPLLCEYVEPRDREQHLYAEVPGGGGVPPPQDVSPTRRPLSFLRALGESLQIVSPRPPAPAQQQDASLLCEYAEPTDAAVHVYSELPPAVAARLANRPLPTKPDEGPSNQL